jgi:hypothetical protein
VEMPGGARDGGQSEASRWSPTPPWSKIWSFVNLPWNSVLGASCQHAFLPLRGAADGSMVRAGPRFSSMSVASSGAKHLSCIYTEL